MVKEDNQLLVNRGILQEHGMQLAVFMGVIQDVFMKVEDQTRLHLSDPETFPPPDKQITEDGFVPISFKELRDMTGMSDFQLRNCKKRAEEAGLIKIARRGIPAKQYFHIIGR